jgi:glycosyltransferase involved in cell wall biosynthesis
MNRPPKIGYVLKRFPRLSETFILNEILELERLGSPLQIYSLIDVAVEEPGSPRHRLVQELHAPVAYLPARQPLKKWRVKLGHFHQGGFASQTLKEICGGEVPPESVLLLQSALIGSMVRAHGVEHLHAHFGSDAASAAMLASRATGIPFSFTAHAKDIFHETVDSDLLRRKISEASFVVTVSDFNQRYLSELAGDGSARKIRRLYNGIDLRRFQPDKSTPREADMILAVGRLQEKKGFEHLIQACAHLRASGRAFRCRIVGEGPQREALAGQIGALGLQEHVRLTGALPQEELIRMFQCATVFVLPCVIGANGDRDALPTVLLEAMAVGLPVISTELVGIPEIIEHGKSGLLVKPGDARALGEAITQVLTQPELREAYARAGLARVHERFDLRKNVPLLKQWFEESAGRGKASESLRGD